MLARPVTFAAKSEYFTGNPGQRIAAAYLRRPGSCRWTVPVPARRRRPDAALGLLQAGELFGIYPEGTRSPDGRLYRGRTGVGWLALASGVPVIPVAMVGTDRVLAPGHSIPSLYWSASGWAAADIRRIPGPPAEAEARRAVTDEVMKAIGGLSGQEFVPMYASVRKEELATKATEPGR